MEVHSYTGPVLVTVAYLGLWYYLLLGLQRGTKYRLLEEYQSQGKAFDRYFGQDRKMLAADRAVINTQEQMVPFLVALWLHAWLVSGGSATWLGGLYILLRAIYPLLLGRQLSGTQSKRVSMVTLPCYVIIFYMLITSVWAVLR